MEEREKTAKAVKWCGALLGVGMLVIGIVRMLGGDALALGEDGLLGVATFLFGYAMSVALIPAPTPDPEEEEDGDKGL